MESSMWDYYFGWMWLGVPLAQSNLRFFDQRYPWKKSVDILDFWNGMVIKGTKYLRETLLVGRCQVCLVSNWILFLDYQYIWKESIDVFCLTFIILSFFFFLFLFLSFIKLN